MANNGNRMPINTEDFDNIKGDVKFNEDNYIFYDDRDDISHYYLSDVIPLFGWAFVSIGDVFQYVGIIGVIDSVGLALMALFIRRKPIPVS